MAIKNATISLGWLVSLFALCAAVPRGDFAPNTCKFGERIEIGPGPCNNGGGTEHCQDSCRGMLADAYVDGSCSTPRPGGDRECICSSACMFGGAWGDPHFQSFDGLALEYHGVCRLVMVETVGPMKTIPAFELLMAGKQWTPDSFLTIPGEMELSVPQWKIKIAVNREDKLTVNGQIQQTPFSFSLVNGRILNFIQINKTMFHYNYFGHREISAFIITTSFGLTVIKEISTSYDRGNGIYVYLPRHPEIVGNISGILGNGDGNKENDLIDNRGKQRVLNSNEITLDGWQFGDSYCINKSEIYPKTVQLEFIEQHNQRMADCRSDSKKFGVMLSLCNKIRNEQYERCLGISGVQAVIEECSIDVCYAPTDAEGDVLCSAMEILNRKCLLDRKCG